jgi:glycosyltransferase involved in cell wall biosynthesis
MRCCKLNASPEPGGAAVVLSALVVVHNEADRLPACLERLGFADEIVVVLDRCTDASETIARGFTNRLLIGAWPIEGDRRNLGIEFCRGRWVLEIDADEHVSPELAAEIRQVASHSTDDRHLIPVDNWIGARRVRHGWGGSFGKAAYTGLFRPGAKRWGPQRVHPRLTLTGREGPRLTNRLDHYVDRDIADMLTRLNRYSSARAADLVASGRIGSLGGNLRRCVTRAFDSYVRQGGWREGGYGLLLALCAGLYPLLSHLKARLEPERYRS